MAQHGADLLQRDVRMIAVVAQVTQHDMMKVFMGEGLEELGRLFIRKMSVAAADALLRGPWTLGICLQKRTVVVGLDKKTVRAAQTIPDQVGDEPHVTEYSQAGLRIRDDKAHGIGSVVGNGKAFDAQILEIEWRTCLHEPPARRCLPEGPLEERLLSECGGEERYLMTSAEDLQTCGMITMLMGEEYPIQILQTQPYGLQTKHDLPSAQAGINEKAGPFGADHGAVARTAAAENREGKHGRY